MSYLWLTGLVSVFYLFDSAMIPFAADVIHLKFILLTLIYLGSVMELNTMLAFFKKWHQHRKAKCA